MTLQEQIQKIIKSYTAKEFSITLIDELKGSYFKDFMENFSVCRACYNKLEDFKGCGYCLEYFREMIEKYEEDEAQYMGHPGSNCPCKTCFSEECKSTT